MVESRWALRRFTGVTRRLFAVVFDFAILRYSTFRRAVIARAAAAAAALLSGEPRRTRIHTAVSEAMTTLKMKIYIRVGGNCLFAWTGGWPTTI